MNCCPLYSSIGLVKFCVPMMMQNAILIAGLGDSGGCQDWYLAINEDSMERVERASIGSDKSELIMTDDEDMDEG